MLATRSTFAAVTLAVLVAVPPVPDAATAADRVAYTVHRKGEPIGKHVYTFDESGSTLNVRTQTDIKVKVAFVTVYRYEHESEAEFDGERLLTFTSRTNDNGNEEYARVRPVEEGLLVEGSAQPARVVPPTALPTHYWREALVERPVAIAAQDGEVLKNTSEYRGAETISVGGRTLEAERYFFEGEKRSYDLYYADGLLVRISLTGPDGSAIVFDLTEPERARTILASLVE